MVCIGAPAMGEAAQPRRRKVLVATRETQGECWGDFAGHDLHQLEEFEVGTVLGRSVADYGSGSGGDTLVVRRGVW